MSFAVLNLVHFDISQHSVGGDTVTYFIINVTEFMHDFLIVHIISNQCSSLKIVYEEQLSEPGRN